MITTFLELVGISVLDPKRAGRIVLSYELSRRTAAELTALVLVLSVLAMNLSLMVVGPMPMQPMMVAAGQALALGVLVLATFLIGKLFGGTGNLLQTLVLICWLQLVLLVIQFLQIAIALIVPFSDFPLFVGLSIDDSLAVLSLFLFFWLYVNFVTVLHSFRSAVKVLVGVVLTIFVLAFGFFSILTVFAVV